MVSLLAVFKVLAGLSIVVILCAGLFLSGISVWAFAHAPLFFHQYGFIIIVLTFGIIISIGSVLWLLGVAQQNKCMLIGFLILVLCVCGVTLIGANQIDIVFPKIFEPTCQDNVEDFCVAAKERYVLAKASFCTLKKCGLKNEAILQGNYTNIERLQLLSLNRNDTSPIKFQDVQGVALNQTEFDFYEILGAIESSLQCSSWCSNNFGNNLYYKFWDINQGRPQRTCYDTLKSRVLFYANVAYKFLIGLQIVLGLACLLSIIISCYQKPERYKETLLTDVDLIYPD